MNNHELENRIKELEADLLEEKRQTQSLKVGETKFQSISNNITTHIAYVNADTLKYEFVNDLFEKSFGIPKDKIIGSHIKDVIGEENYKFALMYIKEVKLGKSCSYENSFILTSGKRWIQVNYSPIFDDNSKVEGIAVVSYDITKEKEGIEALSQTNKYINKLNQFALELANFSSDDNLEAFITKQVKEIAGAEGAIFSEYNSLKKTSTPRHIELDSGLLDKVVNLLGTKFQNIQSEVSDKFFREMTNEMISIRKTLFEMSMGAIPRPVAASIQALLKADHFIGIAYLLEGELYGTIVLAMGVGKPDPPKEILKNFIHLASVSLKRKQAKEELLNKQIMLRTVIDNIPDAISAKDLDCRKTLSNLADIYNTGAKSESEVLGKDDFDLFPKEIAERFYTDDKSVMQKGIPLINREEFLFDNNGQKRWLLTSKIPLRNQNGQITGLVGIGRDITERKKAEQRLKESEEKLIQLNADKDRFISILGHDLKSPFNSLLGFSELLTKNIRKYDIDKIEKFVKIINNSARNTHDLLNDLLEWASNQQGSILFEPQNLNLTDICTDVLITINPSASQKNIVINCLVKDTINVFADAEMLKTVLRNLVSNAIKFTNSSGSIDINAEQDSENVSISVSDNGVGIPPENLGKLFDISEFLTTKGTSGEAGTGLGLLLCKEFVEKHQGKIWVESEEGKGSEFKFTLPSS